MVFGEFLLQVWDYSTPWLSQHISFSAPCLPPKSCNWETVTTYRALEGLKVGPRGENLGNVRREESE